ncbi:MAG: gas vesicle protein [Acidobacteriia bacterium]|nr:gas vesicle protein [Terriglobia bacterium]
MRLDLETIGDAGRISLLEVLDRVLNKGIVVGGEITISIADVDLIYLGLQLVVTSVETGRHYAQLEQKGELKAEKEILNGKLSGAI